MTPIFLLMVIRALSVQITDPNNNISDLAAALSALSGVNATLLIREMEHSLIIILILEQKMHFV